MPKVCVFSAQHLPEQKSCQKSFLWFGIRFAAANWLVWLIRPKPLWRKDLDQKGRAVFDASPLFSTTYVKSINTVTIQTYSVTYRVLLLFHTPYVTSVIILP